MKPVQFNNVSKAEVCPAIYLLGSAAQNVLAISLADDSK